MRCSENCFTCALKIEGRNDKKDIEANRNDKNDLENDENDQENEKNDLEEKKGKNPNSCLKKLAGMAGDAKTIGEVVAKNSLKLADSMY